MKKSFIGLIWERKIKQLDIAQEIVRQTKKGKNKPMINYEILGTEYPEMVTQFLNLYIDIKDKNQKMLQIVKMINREKVLSLTNPTDEQKEAIQRYESKSTILQNEIRQAGEELGIYDAKKEKKYEKQRAENKQKSLVSDMLQKRMQSTNLKMMRTESASANSSNFTDIAAN